MRSGGMSDNDTRRGRGIVRKWIDGRTVKGGPVGHGTDSVASSVSFTADIFDEGSSSISLCTRDEGDMDRS